MINVDAGNHRDIRIHRIDCIEPSTKTDLKDPRIEAGIVKND